MAPKGKTLADLRREIDGIDDALHDLLIRRAATSLATATDKRPDGGNGSLAASLRPAREAAILRRLIERHKGDLPPQVLVRIWREIIAASLMAQAKFHLHVFAGEGHDGFLDLAHAYFGSLTPIRSHARASQVVHACAEEPNSLGLVPLPEAEEQGLAWWGQLAPAGQPGPRIIAKLPFLADGEGTPSAYVIAAIEQELSGDDTTLLAIGVDAGLSRTKLQSLVKEAGFDGKLIAAGRAAEKNLPEDILIEVNGFVGKDDARLKLLAANAGESILRLDPIGGFANPIVLPGAAP